MDNLFLPSFKIKLILIFICAQFIDLKINYKYYLKFITRKYAPTNLNKKSLSHNYVRLACGVPLHMCSFDQCQGCFRHLLGHIGLSGHEDFAPEKMC